jgi:ribosomal protein S12 methylthiotransferase accessory factor
LQLRRTVPKNAGGGIQRECSAAETFERMRPHLRRAGITRVADITGLDRIGIPVYNAIIPRSFDDLSVYNGKGTTAADAMTSAVMEAVERFSAWLPMRPERVAPYAELADAGERVLDPLSHNMMPHPLYHPGRAVSWVRGFDLLAEEEVLVPQSLAGYYVRFHEVPCYRIVTSNGVASGNSLEEAICHGLMEVIERDDWTMADLISHRLKTMVANKLGDAGSAKWLEDRHPVIDPATLPPLAGELAGRISAVGAELVIRNITSETGIPSFAAVVAEDLGPTVSPGHAGYGTHPDAETAVMRALTEAAQSRVVDIQGMREDLTLPGQKVEKWNLHTYRGGSIDINAWPYGDSSERLPFTSVAGHRTEDIAEDIRLMAGRLAARGLDRVIVVDLSPPDLPVHVARVIVPGLEQWGMDQGKLGPRATANWDASLKQLIAMRDARTAAHAGQVAR